MQLKAVLQSLCLENARSAIAPSWEDSMSRMPDGRLDFLEADFICLSGGYVHVPDGIIQRAARAAEQIQRTPYLKALAWHCYRSLYVRNETIWRWPCLQRGLDGNEGLFYLVILLSGFPVMRSCHMKHNISDEVVLDTVGEVSEVLRRHQRKTGRCGVSARGASWLANHLRGWLYKLGRLQFMRAPFPSGQIVFKSRTGDVLALADNGIELRGDGLRNGASGITDTTGKWVSSFEMNESFFRGYPIDPANGVVSREALTLERSAWRFALKPGEPVLQVHIPCGGRLYLTVCADSVARARKFFLQHFPNQPAVQAVVCVSWLLDPQLGRYLDRKSNITSFRQKFYLFPVECGPWSAIRSVFALDIPYGYCGPVDLSALPRRTSLQRILLEHIEAGSRWRKSGGFWLFSSLPWGHYLCPTTGQMPP